MNNKMDVVKMVAFSLSLLLVSAAEAFGCSCSANPTVDKAFSAAKNVVLIKAVSYLDNQKTPVQLEEGVSGFNFVVQKVFKGTGLKLGDQLPVISSGMCSFGFQIGDLGREYLVYYYSEDRFSIVPMCTRSAAVESAAADILYLENISKVRGLTRISGVLTKWLRAVSEGERSQTSPLSSRSVWISGQGRSIKAETDKNGVFEVYGLPPGHYRIQPEKLTGFVPTDFGNRKTESAIAVLPARGHAEVSFNFNVDNAISGTLLDAHGNPLAGVRIDLIPASGRPYQYFIETAYPDKNGRFRFERIPQGTYLIVGNPNNQITADYPYPRFYSSGTDKRDTAQPITIGPGDFLNGIIVRASEPAETVSISGRLRFADGTPVTTGTVKFVTGDGEDRLPGDATAYPDKSGNFKLRVLAGQKGVIFGYVPLNTWVFRSCLERIKELQPELERAGLRFPETRRTTIEAASEISGIDLKFTFALCRER